MLFSHLVVGGLIIAVTVVFHAFALDFIIHRTKTLEHTALRKQRTIWKAMTIAIVVSGVSLALIAEIWLWAGLYIWMGALDNLEAALYFSTSTFTTVGYGDVVLGEDMRMLSAIESLNGFLLFGWSTAFIFEVVTRIYHREGKALES